MYDIYNLKKNKNIRKVLRQNMTKPEIILWSYLKGKQFQGYKFRRQQGIGNYIVDFYCPKLKLVIELDGEQHSEQENIVYDKIRTNYLNSLNIKVLRYWNNEIYKNLDGVIEDIMFNISTSEVEV